MKLVIAGGTGALGRRAAADFAQRGTEVVVLTRNPRNDTAVRQVRWDGRTVGPWATELDGAILLNLAGELVDRRATPRNVALLRQSRVEPTMALVAAAASGHLPSLWLQMSTLAIYGDGGDVVIDESHPAATGPPQMAGVATAWESAFEPAVAQRRVVLRTGVVLDANTPAMNRLSRLVRFGLGGRVGSGTQWFSWIHVEDFLRALRFIVDAQLDGVVHLTAPNPVQNTEMMRALRKRLHRPWSPPTPTPLVRLGARLLGTDPALALLGRRCIPRRLADAGFDFKYETFTGALDALAR
ncbi:MAG: uncharacterized protein QOJ00_1572 [Actinomycetota bacterium]|jgi:uncharacterized protein (TIGR01777 family)